MGNDRKQLRAEALAEHLDVAVVLGDRADIVHHHAEPPQVRVDLVAHLFGRLDEAPHPAGAQHGGNADQHVPVGRRERAVHPEAERGRGVDHDDVDVIRDAAEERLLRVLGDLLPLLRGDVLLVARQLAASGDDEQVRVAGARHHDVTRRTGGPEHLADGGSDLRLVTEEHRRGVGLRVEVEDERAETVVGGQRGREVGRGRGLPDATLLGGHGDHASHGRGGEGAGEDVRCAAQRHRA